MMIPMMALGLIDLFSIEIFKPWSMLILTGAEFGFLITPVYYIRKHGLKLRSLGIKDMLSPTNMLLGIVVGILMIGGNLLISWIITDAFQIPVAGDEALFAAVDIFELAGWIIVMFVAVGFTEELIFRGFLQRRMELYFRGKGSNAGIKALVITSFIFAAIHLDLIGLPTRFMLGMFLGYLAQKTKYSMIGPTIAHGLNNAFVVVLATLLVW
jgi:membrane protease YdiL (CAAX protease family)